MAAETKKTQRPLVVGVGASAGGLDALQAFLRGVPAGCGLAFVVVFHLDPSFKSLLPEVLGKSAPFPVIAAVDGMPVEVDRVYTAPGHSFVSLEGGVVRLFPAERPEERQTVIDHFFQSIARDQGDRGVAIVLSGAGSDGSLGLRSVAAAGGLTMVQDPATAKHESMPRSAMDIALADHVLPPAGLAEELLAYARHVATGTGPEREAALHREVTEGLPEVCEVLLQETGHNFRHYKTSTLIRRTLRRIQVLRAANAREYLERLRADPVEADQLFKELLINVTAFFRDPDAFEALAAEVLRRLFADRAPGDPVRIWVPGCASGEEAYTIAMLVREQLDGLTDPPEVQVFATDIDEAALAVARQGSYPLGIADEVLAGRLQRFFVKKGQQYHIVKEVREMILFSAHNLINDPPFSRLDLISCRNLLIYLGAHLQQKLIPLFHYALRKDGYLFLGPSESLTSHRELFRVVDAKNHISQRLPTAIRSAPVLGSRSGPASTGRTSNAPAQSEADTYLVMQRIILDEFSPKAVVVNEEGQVVSASGNLEKYLSVTAGAFHNSITRLVRDGLRVGLRSTLVEAAKIRRKVVHDGLTLRTEGGIQRIMLTVQPMPQLGEDSGLFLVVFQDVGQPLSPDAVPHLAPKEEAATLIEQLERELTSTRQDLEKTVQDLEAANEELKSANEELLSMNEELQSANEELETSKEEVLAANDALTGSNSDLENLLASTQVGTLFLDDEGKVRRMTAAAATVYNLLPSDTGRSLDHFTHKARVMPPLPETAAVHRADKPFEDEVEMLDGSWFLRRVLPYRTPEGVNAGIVLTFIDVTERRRGEEQVRASEGRFRQLANAMPQIVWTARADGVLDYYNERWYELTGMEREKLGEESWAPVLHPDDLKVTAESWYRCVASGEPYEIECRFRDHRSGAYRWHLGRALAVRDEAGQIVKWFGTSTDIDDYKRIEGLLREREQELQTVADNTPDILTRFDRSFRHVFVNAAITRATGFRPAQVVGKTNRELGMPPELCQVWEEAIGLVFEQGQARALEFTYNGPRGPRYYTSRLVPEHDRAGRVEHALGVTTEVTGRKRAEEALKAADRRKDEFLATLAHELRNPLAPIRNGLEILRHARDTEGAAKVREMMDRQLSHMVRLIDDLLDISRISSGKVTLRKERVSLQAVVEIAVESSRPVIEASRHTLSFDLPKEEVWVNADLTRLAQVVSNLLTNAAKYTPEGGHITLGAGYEGSDAVVRVTDTGLGIPKEMLGAVFEMFTQVNRTLDRSQGGLGIGLALVKRLVEMHGGTITAESRGAGQGSTFTVRLLDAWEGPGLAEVAAPNDVAAPSAAAGLRVLVVDDNEDGAESLAMLIEFSGHTVQAVHSGLAALEAARELVPDLVFLDLGLPGIDGYEVARRLRKEPAFAATTLVALTGWGSADDKRKTKEAGFDHHLTKPVELTEVERLLARLAGLKRAQA